MNFVSLLTSSPKTKNWFHLYSSSAGGKDLSIDSQIRVIGSIEREICTKMLRNLSEELEASPEVGQQRYEKETRIKI